MTQEEQGRKSVELAKQDFSTATERLVETAKRQAASAISDLTAQLKASAHEASNSVSDDVRQVSDSVVNGIRNIKAEIHIPQTVKEHPYAWAAGTVVVGAAAVLGLRSVARALPRPAARGAVSGGMGGRMALVALEMGFTYWMTRRSQRRAAAMAEPEFDHGAASAEPQVL